MKLAIKINNVTIRNPDEYEFGLTPYYSGSTINTQQGRTISGVGKWKRRIKITWNDIKTEDISTLLQTLYSTQYPEIYYFDYYSNSFLTKIFTNENDHIAPIKLWKGEKRYCNRLVLYFTERECSSDINS